MLGIATTSLIGLALLMWLPMITHERGNTADMQCPPNEARIRYPKDLSDGLGYRIAYCKPTGINWR